jgi:hypothetical protein
MTLPENWPGSTGWLVTTEFFLAERSENLDWKRMSGLAIWAMKFLDEVLDLPSVSA